MSQFDDGEIKRKQLIANNLKAEEIRKKEKFMKSTTGFQLKVLAQDTDRS